MKNLKTANLVIWSKNSVSKHYKMVRGYSSCQQMFWCITPPHGSFMNQLCYILPACQITEFII